MTRHKLSTPFLFLIAASLPSFGAQTIKVDRPSALSALRVELNQRYGYLVTYEEGPFDATELHEETLANGNRYISPVWKRLEFQLPDALAAPEDTTAAERKSVNPAPALTPEILDPLVEQYNESGNPGTFSVIYEGQYAHIVQVTRLEDGRRQSFEPIFSTKVTFTSEARTANEGLSDLFHQIEKLRRVGILSVNAGGLGNTWSRKCVVSGGELTARDALEQILNQAAITPTPGGPYNHYVWSLMYDPNWHEYFLSVALVPDMTAHESKAPPLPTGTSPATATSTNRVSKGTRATPIKKN